MATLKEQVNDLRNLLVTTLVDPQKTDSNNRLVGLVEDIADSVDQLDSSVTGLDDNVVSSYAVGDTASRPSDPATGQQYFDTTLGHLIVYDGSAWVAPDGTAL